MDRLGLLLNEVTAEDNGVHNTPEPEHDAQLLSAAVLRESKSFSQFTDIPTILPILQSKNLVTGEEFSLLLARWDRGLRDTTVGLLLQLLQRKGPQWALLLYQSLQEESEHRGHDHLVEVLRKDIEEESKLEVFI